MHVRTQKLNIKMAQIMFSEASEMQFGAASGPSGRTSNPIVTGSSVVALKYCDGVMLMTDTLGMSHDSSSIIIIYNPCGHHNFNHGTQIYFHFNFLKGYANCF